jgi:hypothetical protein
MTFFNNVVYPAQFSPPSIGGTNSYQWAFSDNTFQFGYPGIRDIVANGTVSALGDPITVSLSIGNTVYTITISAVAADASGMVFSIPSNSSPPFDPHFQFLLLSNTQFPILAQGAFALTFPSAFDANIYTANPACFCAGTRILTDAGEVPIEDLKIGDRIITPANGFRPIKWIGRRSYGGRFLRSNPTLWPIRIRAGAIADGVPRRDLFVSPGHSLALDGLLIPAEKLVNRVSILSVEGLEQVDYLHLELDSHDLVFAEAMAAESYVDCDNRNAFQNAAEFAQLYPEASLEKHGFCLPHMDNERTERLDAVRQRVARQSGWEGSDNQDEKPSVAA